MHGRRKKNEKKGKGRKKLRIKKEAAVSNLFIGRGYRKRRGGRGGYRGEWERKKGVGWSSVSCRRDWKKRKKGKKGGGGEEKMIHNSWEKEKGESWKGRAKKREDSPQLTSSCYRERKRKKGREGGRKTHRRRKGPMPFWSPSALSFPWRGRGGKELRGEGERKKGGKTCALTLFLMGRGARMDRKKKNIERLYSSHRTIQKS